MTGRRTLATELRWARARLERRAGRRARVNDDDMISEKRWERMWGREMRWKLSALRNEKNGNENKDSEARDK